MNDEIEIKFDVWWQREGKLIGSHANEDEQAQNRQMCHIAWLNGAYQQSEIYKKDMINKITKMIEG